MMPDVTRSTVALCALAIFALAASVVPAHSQVVLNQISSDTFTNTASQHDTEVEPDTLSYGNTIVSAFQVGRIYGGGAADIGFATSTDGGATWTSGYLPGLTTSEGGTYSAASDAAVAYDPAHGVWIICTLPISSNGGTQVAVSTSTDGITWNNPVVIGGSSNADKNWIACDTYPASPYYGHCYAEWDDTSKGDRLSMSTSTDGGNTWGSVLNTANKDTGIGGQPIVQPSGTVIVPFEGNNMNVFTSTNGGTSWNAATKISSISSHGVAGGLRTSPLPSAEIDSAGTVYVVWQDCRFRTGCKENDIVMSTSSDGNTWSAVTRVPIDATTSVIDHFIPGIAVDNTTSGSTAHIGITYYFYSNTSCTKSTCKMYVGYISSKNGGSTWTMRQVLSPSMSISNLPNTFSGYMVGDYISTSFSEGLAHGVFAVAKAKSGTLFQEAMNTTTNGLNAAESGAEVSSANDRPVPGVVSDHGPMEYWDLDHQIPIPAGVKPFPNDPPDYQ
jgi:hypothetical protein